MAVNLSPVGGVAAQFFTNTSAPVPLTGGKIFTYLAGTTTPATAYTTSQGNIAWSNPIILNSAGRVPNSGEIWITDGLIYKFVLKDANDVLIATYDNITGINSNSVAFVNQQEIITATAGQTVFNLGINYQPGTNSLSVFVDGVNQYGPGAQYAYTETDSNTVTFNSGLHVGALVKFTTTQQQGAGAVDASQVSYDPPFTGSVATNVEAKLAQTVSVTDFGASPSATATANTAAFLAARNYVAANLPITLYIPKGVYEYTDIQNWAYTGLTIEGDSDGGSVLKCVSSAPNHTALLMWAFESGSPTDPFIQKCNLRNIRVEGNSNTLYGIRAYGLARCHWENVTFANANSSNGVAFQFNACNINQFNQLMCSTDYEIMTSIPYYGIVVDTGVRASVNLGAATNNVFTNTIMEGVTVGTTLLRADQNTFLGGTNESCTSIGVQLSSDARFNTFIGHAIESNTTYDVLDSGIYNQYINCYSLGYVAFQGLGCQINGGIFEQVEFQSGSTKNIIENCTVNYAGGVSGGFTDNGDASEWKNLFDQQAGTYIYPLKPRVAISVGASPFTYQNTSRQYQEVIFQSGTLTSVSRVRDGVSFNAPIITPNSIWLAPLESLVVTYSVAPSMSYLPHNGFQG